MDALANLIESFATNELAKLATPLAIAGLVIVGLGCFLGFQRVVDWCKAHVLRIVIGLACIYLAQELVLTVVQSLNGF